MRSKKIKTLDTTLRDGLQGVGVSLSLDERLRLAEAIADLGIDYIEAGFSGSNKTTDKFLARLAKTKLRKKVVVFGSTRKREELTEESPSLLRLANHTFPTVSLVGKTWPLHLRHVLGISREENLILIEESITFLKSHKKKIIYDAEHFFDAWKSDPDYALACLQAARDAQWVTLCDTNGAHLPETVYRATKEAVSLGIKIGIHAHNDAECAVANSLAAVEAGAELVQGTLNGVGERCGNANLSSLLPDLEIKKKYRTIGPKNMKKLTTTSRLVAELTKQEMDAKQPFVGSHAFAHKGGMHGSAVGKNRATFEHIEPERVGNFGTITVSEMAGQGSMESKLRELGIVTSESSSKLLARLKDQEDRGYTYEQAEGSLYLFLKDRPPLFQIEKFSIKSSSKGSRARVEVRKKDALYNAKGKGQGPVEALDKALRKALREIYPESAHLQLEDYRVHIIDSEKGTKATTRVYIEASDGERSWTTLGVSENIVAASLEALKDSYLYLIEKE